MNKTTDTEEYRRFAENRSAINRAETIRAIQFMEELVEAKTIGQVRVICKLTWPDLNFYLDPNKLNMGDKAGLLFSGYRIGLDRKQKKILHLLLIDVGFLDPSVELYDWKGDPVSWTDNETLMEDIKEGKYMMSFGPLNND